MSSLPRIERPKQGAVALTAPGFPFECPGCHAPRTALIGSRTEEKEAKYACGGSYVPVKTDKKSVNTWEGNCGKQV